LERQTRKQTHDEIYNFSNTGTSTFKETLLGERVTEQRAEPMHHLLHHSTLCRRHLDKIGEGKINCTT